MYVAHQGSGNQISVLDNSLNLLTELPLANPWGPAVNTLTNRFYVANTFGGDVWVVDGATNSVLETIALPGNSTLGVAVDETKNRVLATDRYSNELYVIDGTTNSVSNTVPTGNYPAWVAVDESLDRIYVSNQNDGTVSVFDGTSFELVDLIQFAAGSRPNKIAVNDVTHRAYVSLQGADNSTTPPRPPRVAIVDTQTNAVVDEVPVPSGTPYQLDVDDSTSRVFVPTYSGGTVTVIADPVPIDSDGDGIPDSIECEPEVDGGFCDPDGDGHTGTVLSNGTGEPVRFVDLPSPEGVKVIVGGTSGQAKIRVCAGFELTAQAGSEFDLTCGSVELTVYEGPVEVLVRGERDQLVTIPAGTTVVISTPVDGEFTVEVTAGTSFVEVSDPDDPYGYYSTYVYAGLGPVTISTTAPPTVESTSFSAINVPLGDEVEVTVNFTDDAAATHTCEVTWASGVTQAGVVDTTTCTASYTYTTVGLKSVSVRVIDGDGGVGYGGGSLLVTEAEHYWTLDSSASFALDGADGSSGVGIDPNTGDIWVIHSQLNTIAKYAPDGTKQFEVGGFGTGDGQFNGASNIAVGPNGDAYITDVGGNRVQVFDHDGNFVRTFGGGPTPFENPTSIDVDADGNVWVSDVFGDFVRKYSPTGTFLGDLGTVVEPSASRVDPEGYIWVTETRDRVHKIDPDTKARVVTITGFGQPLDVTFDEDNVHVVDSNSKEIRTYTRDAGTFVDSRPTPAVLNQSGGSFQPYPRRAAVDAAGRLLLANGSPTLMVFDPPAPADTDGDGITDDVDSDPNTPSSAFADANGTAGEILANGTGAQVSVIDLPDPEGVRIVTGGTTGQVTVKACGFFTLQVAAGSQVDLACGSIVITVGPGGPLVVQVDGEKELSIEIPSGVSVRISTPVNDDFTIEYLSGTQPVIVREPSDPWDREYPDPRETRVFSGIRSFTTNLPPTVDSVSLSTANAGIGELVELTATFSDPGVDDTHTCEVTWASGVSVPGTVAAGQCTSSYTYSGLGLNSVIVRVTDDAGDVGSSGASVLVFDPNTYWTYDPTTTFDVAGIGIDVDPVTQDVWIVENNKNKVAKYAADGTFLFEVGGFGTAPGLFNSPSVVAVHPSTGDAYITDVGGNRVQQFDRDGNFVRAFGAGSGTAFDNPLGIDVDAAGNVWVADVFNGKVQKFSSTGTYLSTLGGTGTAPYAVSVDPDGFVWVSDFEGSRDRVHKIDPASGQRVLTLTGFGQPVDITFDDVGQAHIVNFNTEEIRTYTVDGDFVASRPMPVVKSNGRYSQPSPYRLAINGDGRLLLTNGSSQVAVFDPPIPPDTDGDGIPDAIECDPDVEGAFCDPDGGGHTGQIITNGTGAPLTFVDLPEPDGVKVIVSGDGGQATIRLCGGFVLGVSAGGEVNVTCGSITIENVNDLPVTLTIEDGDVVTTITIPGHVTFYVSSVVDDEFTVKYVAGTDPVVVEVDGVTTEIDQDTATEGLVFGVNVAPTIDAVSAPTDPVSVAEQPVTVGAEFSDPGIADTHICSVDWGDGATVDGVAATGLSCSSSHTYTQPGVYTVEVTVTDDADDSATATSLIVIYDPGGGFVTGGGWIDSPVGAYVPEPDAAGPARFGFVSQYKKGATVPTGSTQFQFQAGDVNLHSNQFEWLVVSGARAQFRGTGSVNGVDGYRFTVTVIDGDVIGKGQVDRFRMRIWEPSGGLVYDNQMGAADSDDPTTAITQGSIVIHTKGNK